MTTVHCYAPPHALFPPPAPQRDRRGPMIHAHWTKVMCIYRGGQEGFGVMEEKRRLGAEVAGSATKSAENGRFTYSKNHLPDILRCVSTEGEVETGVWCVFTCFTNFFLSREHGKRRYPKRRKTKWRNVINDVREEIVGK